MSEAPLPELLHSEPLAAAGYIRLVRDTIRFANGHQVDRAVVEHPGAVALVVLDEAGRWLLVRQYRHPARRNLLEIPAGTREDGEDPERTAAREVREETGFAAGRLERIGGAWMAPGFSGEFITFYLATDLRPDPLPQDHDEYIEEPEWLTLDEVYDALDAGRIEDAKTMAAVTLYVRHLVRNGGAQ
ncbi:MAG: NUDIX hydrolase [Dehalococcoidia bacterium]